MKILSISGRNLASLAAEFCVDFESEPLASSGLFAICGPTGAGKSTLLDALCLALYDDTPRLVKASRSQLQDVGANMVSTQDPRSLLRRGAGDGHAEVDFVGNDGVRYRARWNVRRSRGKAAGALQPSTMSLHRLPELQAIGGTKTEVAAEIVARIGLSFDQFTRAVLLAQNEFSAFLKTDDNERGELLETLTGSAVYSDISRRAFERHRQEQKNLERLTERLADQTPLTAEARTRMQLESAAAQEALALIDVRRYALEEQLRWYQEAERLTGGVQLAQQAVDESRTLAENAQERRRNLASLDALQPARPLLTEAARLAAEARVTAQAHDSAASACERAAAARAAASGVLAQSQAQLDAADDNARAAAPLLDRAKGLDAAIAALADPHRQARQALAAAGARAQAAQDALETKTAALARSRADLQQTRAWLEQYGQWETLALQWPRWDALLAQAEGATLHKAAMDAQIAQASAVLDAAQAGEAAAAHAYEAARRQLAERDAARGQAVQCLGAFDVDALAGERERLNQQRDALASALISVQGLTAARQKLAGLDGQLTEVRQWLERAQAALAAARTAQPALQAAGAQAERSLSAAELACADSVIDLRARLETDAPCPVCGSPNHPYHDQGALLNDMLSSLRQQVSICRAELQENLAAQAAQAALAANGAEQLAALTREHERAAQALEEASAEWNAHPLAAQSPPGAQLQWLREAADANRAARLAHQTREYEARQAAAARDLAQRAYDTAAAAHAQLQQRMLAARQALVQAGADHAALASKAAQANESVRALLAQLDEALDWQADWRDSWHADPGAVRGVLERHAGRWREGFERGRQLEATLGTLEAELAAVAAEAKRTRENADSQAAEFALIDTRLGSLRAERQELWQGRAVAEVERGVLDAVTAARAALQRQQEAVQELVLAETRAKEVLEQTVQRAGALDDALRQASSNVDDWLAQHAQAHPDIDTPTQRAELERLLATNPAALAHERRALDALDKAVTQALTVLHERRHQLAVHLGERAHEPAAQAQVAQLLAEVMTERAGIEGTAAALRVQLGRDDERRERAKEVLAAIEAQQLVERRWARMNELIGSADGKKFRNYAQQFTLDVLLGYANRHLAQLARRYRLERVVHASGPSLALMVRDQDMGGEIRSVASLSGGESFLVSLALALGLASLSSNRVRVESLFIDEGFGSLDSDTLRVAMEALDALQSMGRKVGVISHVQEMTERIATRVIVQPAGAGASTVTVQ